MRRMLLLLTVLLCNAAPISAAPPELQVEAPESLRAGEEAAFVAYVRWDPDEDPWLVRPGSIKGLEEGDVEVSITAAPENSGWQMVQTLSFTPEAPGTLDRLAVEIPYTTLEAASEEEPPLEWLRSEPLTIEVAPPRRFSPYLLAAAIAVVALAVALVIWLVVTRRRKPAAPRETLHERLQRELHQARRLRLDGDFYAFYQQLEVLAAHAPEGDEWAGLRERYAQKAQAVGYQKVRPTDDELNADLKDAERAVARVQEEQ